MRKTALLLCFIMIFSFVTVMPASAAKISFTQEKLEASAATLISGVNAAELLVNNSFERVSDGAISQWRPHSTEVVDGKSQGFYGSANIILTDDAYSGDTAIKFVNTQGGNTRISYQVSVTGGVTYELSAWVKSSNLPSGSIYIQGGFYGTDADGNALDASGYNYLNLYFHSSANPMTANVWTKYINRFTAPEGATSVILYAYLKGTGDVIWDNISLMCPKEHVKPLSVAEKKDPILTEASATLGPVYAINSAKTTFEGYDLNHMIDKSDSPGGHDLKVTNDQNHTEGGSKSLLMQYGINPAHKAFGHANWYTSRVALVPGATYQLSTWIYAPEEGMSDDFSYWLSIYLADGSVDTKKKHWTITHFPWWREITYDFTVPMDALHTTVQLSHQYGSSPYYVDDIQLYMIKTPEYANIETDELFYYTEWETGVCSATMNNAYGTMLAGGSVEYTFLAPDKETVLDREFVDFADGKSEYDFPLSRMAEKGSEYFISAKVYDGVGNVLQEQILSVYRFDRPTYLGADGIFRKNGKEYNLSSGYSVNSDRMEMGPQKGGVNIVLLVTDYTSDSTIKRSTEEKLRRAEELGLLCLIGCQGSLYDPEALARTAENLKDYPALFGYKLYDEPYQAAIPDDVMKNAYAALRNADPNHPVYVDDSVDGGYDWLYRYADIIDIDYYGGGSDDSGRIFTDKMEKAAEATKHGRKPFTLLQQVFTNGNYRPSIDELRNFAYQAFFAGASGLGWFSLATDSSGGDTEIFMTTELWRQICEIWAPWEQGFLFDCFINDKYELLSSYRDDNAMWRTYRDGNKIYLVTFNRQKNASTEISVPLVDSNGNQLIRSFSATRKAGALGEPVPTVCGNGTLNLTLGGIMVGSKTGTESTLNGLAAEIWEITPYLSVDDFENGADASIYKTYTTRVVEIAEDPLNANNSVLHAAAFPSAVSLLPMTSGTGSLAPVSELFASHEIGKITYRLYIPTQSGIAEGDSFSAGIRYKDANDNTVRANVAFTSQELNKWHNMEFYFNGFTAQPKELCQDFAGRSVECYIDDLKVEKVNKTGFLSTMNASKSGSRTAPNIWAYAASGEYKTSFAKTDVIRPVIGYAPSSISDKAYASLALYKVQDGVLSLVDMKMSTLGRTPLASLTSGAGGAESVGITSDELVLNLSAYDLTEGTYSLVYLLWNQSDLSAVMDKTTIFID
ncbi:MAG: carbohydrate binding domain-containing protein [Clostridia bacterium]|nr:carbohydrate binding domain-containing protein [Clostridia bacterium]